MHIRDVRAFRLSDCEISPQKWAHFTSREPTEGWLRDDALREGWFSADCLLPDPASGRVYVGLTALNGDIFYTFDPHSGTLESLRYPARGDRYAHKIHKSLEWAGDGSLFAAVATLGDVDIWPFAPGGEIFRYDPQAGSYARLCIPLPHDYVQGLKYDAARGLLYGDTFPGRKLFRYDLASGEVRVLTHFGGATSEQLVLDPLGGLWRNYELAQWAGRCPLLRYDPDADRVEFLNLDLPDVIGSPRTAVIDSALLAQDGALYVGTTAGALARLDYAARSVSYLGKPLPAARLKGLLELDTGLILGAGGSRYQTALFIYDPASGAFHTLGSIQDSQDGTRCWLAHDACQVDERTLVVAETDNPERSSCLFVITLDK